MCRAQQVRRFSRPPPCTAAAVHSGHCYCCPYCFCTSPSVMYVSLFLQPVTRRSTFSTVYERRRPVEYRSPPSTRVGLFTYFLLLFLSIPISDSSDRRYFAFDDFNRDCDCHCDCRSTNLWQRARIVVDSPRFGVCVGRFRFGSPLNYVRKGRLSHHKCRDNLLLLFPHQPTNKPTAHPFLPPPRRPSPICMAF